MLNIMHFNWQHLNINDIDKRPTGYTSTAHMRYVIVRERNKCDTVIKFYNNRSCLETKMENK